MSLDKALKREIRLEAGMSFGRNTPGAQEAKAAVRQILENKLRQRRLQIDGNLKEKAIIEICYDLLGFGPIEPLLADPSITEVMVNGPHEVYVERAGRKVLSAQQFDDEAHLRAILDKMLALAGRRLDESSPYVDFSLNDGSRINAIIAPISVD